MEASGEQAITPGEINVRQVTHWQPSWTEAEPGAPGTFSLQLILDEGAAEHVLRPTADDLDVLVPLLESGKAVYFDMERQVLMFQNRSAT